MERQKLLQDLKAKVSAEQYVKLQELANRSLIEKPRAHLDRVPLLLPLLGAFGLVATFYGFEKLLDQTDLVKLKIPQNNFVVGVGSKFKIVLEALVAETWHVNSNKPYDEFLIARTKKILDLIKEKCSMDNENIIFETYDQVEEDEDDN